MHETEQYEGPADCMRSQATSTRVGNEKEACTRLYGLVRREKTGRKKEEVRRDVLQMAGFDENNTASSREKKRGGNRTMGTGRTYDCPRGRRGSLKVLRQHFLNFKSKGKRNLRIL